MIQQVNIDSKAAGSSSKTSTPRPSPKPSPRQSPPPNAMSPTPTFLNSLLHSETSHKVNSQSSMNATRKHCLSQFETSLRVVFSQATSADQAKAKNQATTYATQLEEALFVKNQEVKNGVYVPNAMYRYDSAF